jgi:hypothetical protein
MRASMHNNTRSAKLQRLVMLQVAAMPLDNKKVLPQQPCHYAVNSAGHNA